VFRGQLKRAASIAAQAVVLPVFAGLLIVLWLPIVAVGLCRRYGGRTPRIVFTPTASINNIGYAQAMRRKKYVAVTTVYDADSMISAESYDVFVPLQRAAAPIRLLIPYAAFIWALTRFDIVFCYFNVGGFLAPTVLRYAELPLFKLFAKKIIAAPYGADVQRWSLLPGVLRPFYSKDREAIVERNVRHTAKCSDFKISGGDLVDHMPHDICLSLIAADLNTLQPHYPRSDNAGRRRIIHATGHPQLKGTQYIEQACRELKDEGYDIDYLFVSGLENVRAREIYASADIIVDQLLIGTYGMFAVEGMALGKPVVSYVGDGVKAANPTFGSLPIVVADPATVKGKLKELLDDASLRLQIGLASRVYAEKFHGLDFMADLFDRIICHVWLGAPAPQVTADGLSALPPGRSAPALGHSVAP
jgi:glycosyltransferase involved in cell wall biosynthesis